MKNQSRILKILLFVTVIIAGFQINAQVLTIGSNIHYVTSGNTYLVLNNGGIKNNGTFHAGNGTVVFSGGSYVIDTGTSAITYNNITLSGNGTKVNSNNVAVKGTVSVSGSTIVDADGYANNKTFTLRSTATSQATVAQGSASGGYITGNVTVERYIAPNTSGNRTGRAWRLLTAPVSGTSINAAWQEGLTSNNGTHSGTATPGYGTLITGYGQQTAGNANLNGFDFWNAISNSTSSLRRYSITGNSGNWGGFLNNTHTPIDSLPAYMLYVRGDRSVSTGTSSNATTLRATGTIKQGTQTISVPPVATAAYTLVGNPFPSPIDFEKIYTAQFSIIKNRFWLWDANLNIAGGYRLVERTGANDYNSTPYNMNIAGTIIPGDYQFIEPGAGFFVEPENGGSFTIAESHKTGSTPPTTMFRTNNATDERMYINLNSGSGSKAFVTDGVQARFGTTYSAAIAAEDIAKPGNFNEGLAIRRSNTSLTVEGRPLITNKDTIFLSLTNTAYKNYQLQLKADNFSSAGVTGYVEDSYTGQSHYVNMYGNVTTIEFVINSNAASQAPDRFRVVFQPGTILPVSYTSIKAYRQNSSINVEWNTVNETNLLAYDIERSADGITFYKVGTQKAMNSVLTNNYKWPDPQPLVNDAYYRIKGIGKQNDIRYSSVVLVKANLDINGIAVFPNPISNGTASLQFTGMAKGTYTVKLVNPAGQVLLTRQIINLSGSLSQNLPIHTINPGVYYLQIIHPNNTTSLLNILVK